MDFVSDPTVKPVEQLREPHSENWSRPLPARAASVPVTRGTKSLRSVGARALVGVVVVLVALRSLASVIAAPLEPAGTASTSEWSVAVTTTRDTPGLALVYGTSTGVRVVKVPAIGDNASSRFLHTQLPGGQLHLLSLSPTSLRVHATAPTGANAPGTPVEMSATSPIVTLYRSPEATGIRTRW